MRHRLLLLFAVGFCAGICVAVFYAGGWWFAVSLGLVSIFALCYFRDTSPFIVLLIGVALGALRLYSFFPPGSNIESFAGPAPVTIYGTICSDPVEDSDKTTFVVATSEVVTRSGIELIEGKIDVLVHSAALPGFLDPRFGDNISVAGMLQHLVPNTNPGEFDFKSHLIGRGISGELLVQRPNGAVIRSSASPFTVWESWSVRSEHQLESAFNADLPGIEPELLAGILFGRRSELSPQLQQEFVATGTAHILATAGLHIAILAMTFAAALGVIPMPRKFRAVIVILLLWLFACLAGGRPAVVRAVIAATIYYCGSIFERIPDIPTTLATAGLGILTVQPAVLFESDFQLSFATVVGLALIMPFCEAAWKEGVKSVSPAWYRQTVRRALELISLSVVAQLCSSPLIAYYYNVISLLSLPANLVVVPLLFLVIPLSAIGIFVHLLSPAMSAMIFRFAVHPLLWLILQTVSQLSSVPACVISVPSPPAIVVIGVYASVYGCAIKWHPVHKTTNASSGLTVST